MTWGDRLAFIDLSVGRAAYEYPACERLFSKACGHSVRRFGHPTAVAGPARVIGTREL